MTIKQLGYILLLLWGSQTALAQTLNTAQLKNMRFRSVGPAAMSGRVTALDVDIQNDIIYAGTASGGLWMSDNEGVKWSPIFDKQITQSIGSVKVNQRNPLDIWVGTGEGNPRNSQNSGRGIFRSLDGGKNWKSLGLTETRAIHRIALHRDNPEVAWAGALGSSFGPNSERGVFKTSDGGKTWRKVLFVNDSTGCADLVIDPQNPNKLIAAMWEFGRKPWTFSSGGKGSGLYVSHDAGETWERRTELDGLPKGDLGRIGLAIAPSQPNVVYALVEAKENALYRSNDGGFKWTKVGKTGDRPFYYSEIYVSPTDENTVYSVYTLLGRSLDGGKNWETFAGWIIHPDHHAMWIHPSNPDYIIDGNDGGINITKDGGRQWRFAENLPIGQFYHINVDNEVPYNIYGGLQDNGSWIGPSAVWRSGGIRNEDWQEVLFGDGFDVMPRRDDTRYGYAMSQGGELNYYDKMTGFTQSIKPVHPDKNVTLRFNWNAGLAQNPFHDKGIYYGSQYVHRSMDCGNSWEIISPDLTTNDSLKQLQAQSGGLTPDATAAENHCTILCIAPSPLNEKAIWVGTDDGKLHLTLDAGKTWNNLADKLPNCPKGAWFPQIEVSQHQAGEAFVVANHYRMNDWKPYVYHTLDYGNTWKRIADEKQVSSYCMSIVQDPEVPSLLFLGADNGLYISINGGKDWAHWYGEGLPATNMVDMKIQAREADLAIATFGRANYVLDDIRPLREIAKSEGKVLTQNFKVFAAPDAYLANYRSYQGPRFPAHSGYTGENEGYGAMFSIWRKPEIAKPEDAKKEEPKGAKKEEKKDDKKNDDDKKLRVTVLDMQGDTVRRFSQDADTLLSRVYWNLSRDGVRFPSNHEPEADADLPSGDRVAAGKYKVFFKYKSDLDSCMVNVLNDPRLPISPRDAAARLVAIKQYEQLVKAAADAYTRLGEAEKTIKLVDDMMLNVPDSTKANIKKIGATMKDSILIIKKIYMEQGEQKGMNHASRLLMDKLYEASGLLENSLGEPNANTQQAVANTRADIATVLEKVNRFFETLWPTYQQQVEAGKGSLFKTYSPLKIGE